ncbi:transketolase C-terminal domain-containing protein [Streptomyces sp. WMMB303]|uniref:transketolase C-terminal domain-containing protein n=1 Tax=Streptomyces sp. WMMB303 TaxID=3034154 RepID=UPI0023ED81C2|nr:transketolase C-terminal domain-containing protein [Streptomyces sp. WMMB303]MDF4251745.1 transketolase C-terminal domain-containing protein [Streptomyces sp. WMMB303]
MSHAPSWVPASEFARVREEIADPYDRAAAVSTLARLNTLYMIERAGSGHLGSSFSAADIVTQLYLSELRDPAATDGDVYFSSKGHDVPGLYALLAGLGHLDEGLIHRLRRLDGLPGHPDVGTPHMPFNTGSLGMGISKAKGLVLADRLAGRDRRVYVLTGDGELQEGQNWEALAGAVRHGMRELTVVVDHNKIQSDTWVADVSDLGDLEAKFRSFGWGVVRCDGNDPQALEAAFAKRAAAFPDGPAVLVADTVKGAGCGTFAATSMCEEEWRYRYHSGAPSPEDCAAAYAELWETAGQLLARHGVAPVRPRPAPVADGGTRGARESAYEPYRLTPVYGEALIELAHRDPRVVALDADLVLDTGLIPFREQFPDRFFEFGIAEQDMVSAAGGLAAGGRLPFVHSFSCFLHSRPNEQIYNNATEGRRIVYAGSLAGLVPAAPGHSHQAVRDVSALGAVPGLVVAEPANAAQTRALVRFAAAARESVYLRLSSAPVRAVVDALPLGEEPLTGRGTTVRRGGPLVAVGAGPVVLEHLMGAAQLLAADGVELTVVDLPWLNRVDPDWLAGLARGAQALTVVEHHYTHGGQADTVARALLELGLTAPPAFRGLGLTRLPDCGTEAETLAAHALDAASLAAALRP